MAQKLSCNALLTTDLTLSNLPNAKQPGPKTKKLTVLDEETYLYEMGKIIERDFFPDLEKLRAQNDYLEALERNDLQKIRELYTKYSSGRPLPQTSYASPATFETPLDSRPVDEDETFQLGVPLLNVETSRPNSGQPQNTSEAKTKLSLDSYLRCYTSEDNQSFQETIKESEIQHRQRHSWLYDTEDKHSNMLNSSGLDVPSIEEQAKVNKRPFNLDTWSYRSKNFIMYVPDGVKLTNSEQLQLSSKKNEINHNNTHMAKCPFDENQNKETIQGLAISQSRFLEGKIGVDGKELTFGDTPKVNGFSFVQTPSPAPGVNDSPLMTWGDIDGTPFRLDGGDTPLRASNGPSFKIPEPPKREKLALALAEKAGVRHRDRKKRALLAAHKQFSSPQLNQNYKSSLDRLHSMSPAAQKLASTHLRRIRSDRTLQASYSPATRTSDTTPKTLDFKFHSLLQSSETLATASTPKKTQSHNITDNLLNLPKRPRAADYFDL